MERWYPTWVGTLVGSDPRAPSSGVKETRWDGTSAGDQNIFLVTPNPHSTLFLPFNLLPYRLSSDYGGQSFVSELVEKTLRPHQFNPSNTHSSCLLPFPQGV